MGSLRGLIRVTDRRTGPVLRVGLSNAGQHCEDNTVRTLPCVICLRVRFACVCTTNSTDFVPFTTPVGCLAPFCLSLTQTYAEPFAAAFVTELSAPVGT